MKAIPHSGCERVGRLENVHLITSVLCFQVGERKKERGVNAAEITRSGQLLGVNNDAVVSEMTELCFCLVSVGLRRTINT